MSELRADSRPRNSSVFWRAYMMSWAVLSGSALTYLIMYASPLDSPDTELAQNPGHSTTDSRDVDRSDSEREQLTAQVRSLNKTVASLRSDLARIKQEAGRTPHTPPETPVAQSAEQGHAAQPEPVAPQGVSPITTSSLPKANAPAEVGETAKPEPATTRPSVPVTIVNAPNSSVPIVEAAPSPSRAPAMSETTQPPATIAAAPAPNESQPIRRRNLATSLLRPGRVPPLPPYNERLAGIVANPSSSDTASSATTLSAAQRTVETVQRPVSVVNTKVATTPQPTSFGTPVVKPRQQPATSAAALSLSTAQSVTGLRASWLLLTTRHPEIFVGYQPRYVADQANGNYRLIAGPIADHSDADRICTRLRAQNVSCGVTAYVGSAL